MLNIYLILVSKSITCFFGFSPLLTKDSVADGLLDCSEKPADALCMGICGGLVAKSQYQCQEMAMLLTAPVSSLTKK
jgi:hypothetical protein